MFDKKQLFIHISLLIFKVAVVAGLSAAGILALSRNTSSIADSIVEGRTLAFTIEKRAETVRNLKDQLSRIGDKEEKLVNAIPPIENILGFVRAMKDAGRAYSDQYAVSFGAPQKGDSGFFEVPYDARFGGTVSDITAYIRRVESLPFFSSIESIEVRAREGGSWKNASTLIITGKLYAR